MLRRPGGWRVNWSGKGSNGRNGLVASVVGSLLSIVHWGEGRGRQRRGSRRLGCGEAGASHDQLTKLRNGDPLSRVELKDAPHDGIQLRGDGKNGPEELGILHVGTEGAVLERGALPWVAAACEVHQDYSEAPHVVGCGRVAGVSLWRCSLAFCQALARDLFPY